MTTLQHHLQQRHRQVTQRRHHKHQATEPQRRSTQTPQHQQHNHHTTNCSLRGSNPGRPGRIRQPLADQETARHADHNAETKPQGQAQQKRRSTAWPLAITATLAPQHITGHKQQRPQQAHGEVQPFHQHPAVIAKMQGIHRRERIKVQAALPRSDHVQDPHRGVQHHMRMMPHISRHRTSHIHPAGRIAVTANFHPIHAHLRQRIGRSRQIIRHRHHGNAFTLALHRGPYRRFLFNNPTQLRAKYQGSQHHGDQRKGAHGGAGHRHDQVEGQADHTDQVVHVLPVTAHVALVLEGKEFLAQFRPMNHQAGEQGGAVQNRDQPHEGHAQVDGQAATGNR